MFISDVERLSATVSIGTNHPIVQLFGLFLMLAGATAGVFGVIDLWTATVIGGIGTTFDVLVSAHGRRTVDHGF